MEVERIPGYRNGSIYFTCEAGRGYYYCKKTAKPNGVIYLKCIEKECLVRASCNEQVFLKLGEDHTHPPDMTKKDVLHLKHQMITAAVSTNDDIKTIFVRNSASTSVDAAAQIAFPALSKSMRRQRIRNQPNMPTTLREFGEVCKESLRFGMLDGKPFCRGTVGENTGTAVIFLAEDLSLLLSSAKELHIDGTFKTRPRHPQSSQLLTIIAIQYGMAFPCAFALMKSRTVVAYKNVFEKLKELMPSFSPQLIMTDYEAALTRSLNECFPNATKTGCFFHYCQAIMRQSAVLGMTRLLKENLMAQKGMKMLLSLPFLPTRHFPEGVQHINRFLTEKELTSKFRTLLRYHERQWLRRVGPDSISVFGRVRRTNNDAESFHASLARILRIRGPNVWEFTDCLRKITATTIREVSAFVDRGLQIRVLGKRKYRLNDRRIQRAVDHLNHNENVPAFLEMVCSTTQAILDRNLVDGESSSFTDDEEQLLVSLDGNVPREYEIVGMPMENQREEEGRPDNETEVAENSVGEFNDNVQAREPSGQRSEDALCIICKEVSPTTVLLPCAHFGLCDQCTAEMEARNNEVQVPDEEWGYTIDYALCPLDRQRIEQFVRVVTT